MAALKRVPGLRESSYAVRAAGRTAANALYHPVTRKTYAATRLERIFARKPDPWDFEHSPDERERFQKTWELVPRLTPRRILEIGCAEGHFTQQIAGRFPDADVLALDFVPLALERAKARCAGWPRVHFHCLDIAREPIEGDFDLIFCMGVLEYGPPPGELDTIRRSIVRALRPSGCLVIETCAAPPDLQERWWAWWLVWGARAHHDRFLVDGMVSIAEAYVCGDARLTTVFRKMP
jgi:SAM-dependent methyltransferase